MARKGLGEFLPTSVQKSYFMLSDAERKVLNSALEKYRPGQSEPILVGGENLLKPALRLMSLYRLRIEGDQGCLPSPLQVDLKPGAKAKWLRAIPGGSNASKQRLTDNIRGSRRQLVRTGTGEAPPDQARANRPAAANPVARAEDE